MNKYYYLDSNGQQQGPVDADKLSMYGVKMNTQVWQSGMQDWVEAGKVPEISSILMRGKEDVPPPVAPPKPDNLLVWSILTTVLCCLPLGIVAIINSNKVDNLWNNKDYEGAINAAKNAKMYCLISLGGGILIYIFAIFSGLIGALS